MAGYLGGSIATAGIVGYHSLRDYWDSTQAQDIWDTPRVGGSGKSLYQTPPGGGGITNTIKTANGTITFGHGGRHVPGADISVIEQSIANTVPKLNIGQNYTGIIYVNGINIKFRAFGVSEGVINIGTYFPEQ